MSSERQLIILPVFPASLRHVIDSWYPPDRLRTVIPNELLVLICKCLKPDDRVALSRTSRFYHDSVKLPLVQGEFLIAYRHANWIQREIILHVLDHEISWIQSAELIIYQFDLVIFKCPVEYNGGSHMIQFQVSKTLDPLGLPTRSYTVAPAREDINPTIVFIGRRQMHSDDPGLIIGKTFIEPPRTKKANFKWTFSNPHAVAWSWSGIMAQILYIPWKEVLPLIIMVPPIFHGMMNIRIPVRAGLVYQHHV